MTHICASKLTIIDSDNGLLPGRRQAIIWNNAGILLIGPFGTNLSEIFIKIHTFWFTKMHLEMSFGKWQPFCLGLNVLTHWGWDKRVSILHLTYSNSFSCVKIVVFWLKFHWNLFPMAQLTIIKPALVHIMAWRQTDDKLLSEPMMAWCLYAPLSLDELTHLSHNKMADKMQTTFFEQIQYSSNMFHLFNKSASVDVMALYLRDRQLLLKPELTKMLNTIWHCCGPQWVNSVWLIYTSWHQWNRSSLV